MIDLHSHTTYSDGERTPSQLLADAAASGVEVLAVTDHDTVSGIREAGDAARSHGVRLVPGIELSCESRGREVHVLGHFLDPQSQSLVRLAAMMLGERRERMEKMVALAVKRSFFEVTMDRVIACSGGENLGRPHLARVLVDHDYAASLKDAFDKFLHTGGPLWADRRRLTVAEAVELIRDAGGTSSLAHPGVNEVSRHELCAMADLGLDAVEAQHPDHDSEETARCEGWAKELGLLVTAGSDYHGPTMQPGRRPGDRTLSRERFAALEARRPV